MPSRKRNKGKERRAKKEAARGAWWRGWASQKEAGCSHGCAVIPPPGHAVSKFMNTFDEEWNGNDILAATKSTFTAHPEVWHNNEHQQMTIDMLLNIGTNLILGGSEDLGYKYKMAQQLVLATHIIEGYDGEDDLVHPTHIAAVKGGVVIEIGSNRERDILKFYTKRLPCACLKDKYKHARHTIPKTGRCHHCHQDKERATLWTCGRCRFPLYCSRECQVAHAPEHKEDCCILFDIRKRHDEKKKALSS